MEQIKIGLNKTFLTLTTKSLPMGKKTMNANNF